MKNTITILTMLFTQFSVFGQVGIGTVTPLADLHIADTRGTIRIESINATNAPTLNDGVELAPVFVNGKGDVVLGDGTGATNTEPLNFLIDIPNFIDDNVDSAGFGRGSVVNSAVGDAGKEGLIGVVSFTTPIDGYLELKYSVTAWVAGNDLNLGCAPCTYPNTLESIVYQTYFLVDFGSDGGPSGSELTTFYGNNGQYFVSNTNGGQGYAYINGIANLKARAGTHTIYMYGVVRDSAGSFTSVSFGGAEDFLKIRVYN